MGRLNVSAPTGLMTAVTPLPSLCDSELVAVDTTSGETLSEPISRIEILVRTDGCAAREEFPWRFSRTTGRQSLFESHRQAPERQEDGN